MASQFDPWPLVIAEATAAGMSVIASDRCGNAAELGARQVPFGDVEAMAREMLTVEREWSEGRIRPQAGLANPYAASYDCKAWAKRTLEIARRTCRIRGFCPGMDDPATGMAVVARLLARDEAIAERIVKAANDRLAKRGAAPVNNGGADGSVPDGLILKKGPVEQNLTLDAIVRAARPGLTPAAAEILFRGNGDEE